MSMPLRQLEIFRAVMQTGSFTAAGEALQMSQPAVTKAIRRMEDRLGFALFARGRGRIRPTPEAASLHLEAEKVFSSIAVVEKFAYDLREAHSGVLSIASTPTMSCGFLTEAIAAFRKKRPKVRVWLQITTTKQAMELAASGQIDLALVYAPGEHEGLDVIPLFSTEVVCVMPPGHALAQRPELSADELRDVPIITNVRNQPLHDLIDLAFQGVDLDRSVMIGTNSTITACALVRSGAGIAVVEPMGVAEIFPDLVMRPLHPRVVLMPRAMHARRRPLSRVCQQFLKVLQSVASTGSA
ncbi:DNA-binding transcriptional regulator, LysR family [Devosia enhydra]|uniref:DNA-binding transcriptional regulator, LysR family n=1 Tax=Devosia enhydra TaxID=665118 RepID=A0A1K2I0V5_9HYPH|nr:LysR family transcriptional regulator [Devosia enhydra]SFZ85952.1 DNA-binding transcriptional regulator, LysR family [Devosia enhydra]